MGLTQSSLAQPGTDLVVEPMSFLPRGGRGVDQAKPPDLRVDDALWSELVRRIDPLARDLNRGMAVVAVVPFVAVVAVLVVSWSVELPVLYIILPALVVTISATSYILGAKNGGVDRRVEEVLREIGPRFEAAGYQARYKTQYTGPCKPKRTRSERVISFARISGVSTVETGNSAAAVAWTAPPTAPGWSAATDAESGGGWKGGEATEGKSLADQLEVTGGKSLMDQLKS